MAEAISTSMTRRSVVAGLTLTTAAVAVLTGAHEADAQDKSLYERLGGVFVIAPVVNHFSDAIVKNPIVGQSPRTRN